MLPKLNRDLVAVKSHFFFFFAALGPLLPQMNVFGKQLGVSPLAMGLVTAVLPLLWALAKPAFGYLVDFFPNQRKAIFMMLICVMSGSYCGLWGLPAPENNLASKIESYVFELNDTVYVESYQTLDESGRSLLESYKCHWNGSEVGLNMYLSHTQYINTVYVDGEVTNRSCSLLRMGLNDVREGEIVCELEEDRHLICFQGDLVLSSVEERNERVIEKSLEISNNTNATDKSFKEIPEPKTERINYSSSKSTDRTVTDESAKANRLENDSSTVADKSSKENNKREQSKSRSPPINNTLTNGNETDDLNDKVAKTNPTTKEENSMTKSQLNQLQYKNGVKYTHSATAESDSGFYTSAVFWWFVVLMCVGTVAFNVANCIGDAVCFDVLGPERASKYGSQRAWGTAGYGLTALLGGWAVDAVSTGEYKNFYPAFLLAAAFTVCDLVCCRKLKLPQLSSPTDSGKALRDVLRMPKVLVFIMFAVIAGTFDSFIIYYMFWFLEELAESTGHSAKIKLIEGVVVAGQSFVGELLFFYFSGRIIRRLGYGTTMSISLLCYGVRMMLVSFITNPWHLVIIESVMQGPTYALCYASIVGYAATVAPEGYSATVQGIVAGMDDGLGFALGSLVGGQLYSHAGGRGSFRVMAAVAVVAALAHVLLRRCVLERGRVQPKTTPEEGEKMLQVQLALSDNGIYRDTVLPLNGDGVKVSDNR